MWRNVIKKANFRGFLQLQSSLLRSFLFQRQTTPPLASSNRLPVPGPSRNGGIIYASEEHKVEHALTEALQTLNTPEQLRLFFVHLLVNDHVASPIKIWNDYQDALARDLILKHDNVNLGLNEALQELDRALGEHGKSLAYYRLPEPSFHSREVAVELEKWEPQAGILAARSANAVATLNKEQHEIYSEVMDAVANKRPLWAFVDGKAGRGKTFLVNAICNKLRSEGHVVLATASSGSASQLYPGGKTAHSMFKIPIGLENEKLTSPIQPHDPRGELIQEASVIIWDEAPMTKNSVLHCVDEVCRRVMRNNLPFGGKVVILLGDFRQTCPVVRNGTRQDIVEASIRSSPLWPRIATFRLHQPVRGAEDLPYAAFVDDIGDGAGPTVPLNLLEHVSSRRQLIEFVFPDDVLVDPARCLARAILAPTNMQVDEYNRDILRRIDGPSKTYQAADALEPQDPDDPERDDVTDPALVLADARRASLPGVPAHMLDVKVHAVYRLMCNFAPERGLVKNTRVLVTRAGPHLVTVRALRGIAGIGGVAPPMAAPGGEGREGRDAQDVLVSRIPFTARLESGHTLVRRQFPLAPAYATTFNSCQGLTLDVVGVDLTLPVFSHGQLYTALSRIRHRSHARVRLREGQTVTKNVTFHEVLL